MIRCQKLAALFVVIGFAPTPGLLGASQAPGGGEVLTNASVGALVASRLDRKLIIAKIQDSRNTFDVTASGLVGLHQREIPKVLIEVMLQSAAEAAAADVVTNQAVLLMVDGRLPQDLIITKIRASSTAFDVSTEGLVLLQQRKVPRAIIQVMMQAGANRAPSGPLDGGSAAAVAPPPPPPNARAPMGNPAEPTRQGEPDGPAPRPDTPLLAAGRIPKEAGIYLHLPSRASAAPLRLEPTTYTATRTANVLGSALTSGISKAKLKAVVRSPRAGIQVADPNVEFYFIFETQSGGLSNSNAWFAQLTSPNEFALVRLEIKTNTREVTVGEMGAFGAEVGTDDRANVPFTLERLRPGVYRVRTEQALTPGQYAFMSVAGTPGAVAGAASPNRLFDFGVGGRR